MKRITLIFYVFVSTLAFSQNLVPQKIESIQLSSGRTIEIYDDGTWKYTNMEKDKEIIPYNKSANFTPIGPVLKIFSIIDSYTPDNTFFNPEIGKRYVCFDVAIDNNYGRNNITVNSVWGQWFELKDTDGRQYSTYLYSIIEPQFKSNDIEPGDISRGWLIYEIDKYLPINKLKIRFVGKRERSDWINLTSE